jgi:hypothetical protein
MRLSRRTPFPLSLPPHPEGLGVRAVFGPGRVEFACPACKKIQYVTRKRWRRNRGLRCKNRDCPFSILVTRLPSGPVARLRPRCDYKGDPVEERW